MSRLTEKNNRIVLISNYSQTPSKEKIAEANRYNKLAELEDLEEELGCPLEEAVDILLTLKNNMEVETDSFNGSTKVGKNLYINFNGESLRFKDRETEIKIMNWLKKDKSE